MRLPSGVAELGHSLSAGRDSGLVRPPETEMAPLGFIRVNGYEQNRDGKSVLVHSYLRRLPAKYANRLTRQNILYFYWHSTLSFPFLKDIVGFSGKGSEYDRAIQFWLDFWTKRGIVPIEIDPLIIKALISVESEFDPNAIPPPEPGKKSTATGLMQVLGSSFQAMNGLPGENGYREIKKNLLLLHKREDLFDPIINICSGTRWLAHKYSIIPKGYPKDVHNMLKNYRLWGKVGDNYATKVLRRYEKSK